MLSTWLGTRFHRLLSLGFRVGSRFWGHSAVTISRLACMMEDSDSSLAIGDRRGPLWVREPPAGHAEFS
jgi:hypothetical protein